MLIFLMFLWLDVDIADTDWVAFFEMPPRFDLRPRLRPCLGFAPARCCLHWCGFSTMRLWLFSRPLGTARSTWNAGCSMRVLCNVGHFGAFSGFFRFFWSFIQTHQTEPTYPLTVLGWCSIMRLETGRPWGAVVEKLILWVNLTVNKIFWKTYCAWEKYLPIICRRIDEGS